MTPGFSALFNGQEWVQSTDLDHSGFLEAFFSRKPTSVSFLFPALWKQCSKSYRSDCSCHLQGRWSGGQTLSGVLQKMQRLREPWVCLHVVSKLHQLRLLLWGGAAFPKSRANPTSKKLVHPKLLLFRWQEDTALCFPPSRFLLPLPKTSRTPSQNNWKPPFFHTISNFLPIKPLIFKCHLNGSRHF